MKFAKIAKQDFPWKRKWRKAQRQIIRLTPSPFICTIYEDPVWRGDFSTDALRSWSFSIYLTPSFTLLPDTLLRHVDPSFESRKEEMNWRLSKKMTSIREWFFASSLYSILRYCSNSSNYFVTKVGCVSEMQEVRKESYKTRITESLN